MSRTYIDLHTHSTASDGSETPEDLVTLAKRAEVVTMALTDHDTTAGVEEAMETGQKLGVEVIPGCELSVRTELGELHILGLWLPPDAPRLHAAMDDLRQNRANRNLLIVEKLRSLGMDIQYDEVLALAGDGSVGRPHIARVMLAKGYVHSLREVFDRYLGETGAAHVPKKVLSPKEGVELLKAEGATVSLAHMFLHGYPEDWLEDMVSSLAGYGMDALEAYHSEHDAHATRCVVDIAARHGLALTGGSDYHGAVKPNIMLGRGKGGLYVPPLTLNDLKSRRRAKGLPV